MLAAGEELRRRPSRCTRSGPTSPTPSRCGTSSRAPPRRSAASTASSTTPAGAHPGTFATLTDEDWVADLDVKLFRRPLQPRGAAAPAHGRRRAHRQHRRHPGRAPDPAFFATSVNRAAGNAFTKTLALEVAKDNILVNGVNIGFVSRRSGTTSTGGARRSSARRVLQQLARRRCRSGASAAPTSAVQSEQRAVDRRARRGVIKGCRAVPLHCVADGAVFSILIANNCADLRVVDRQHHLRSRIAPFFPFRPPGRVRHAAARSRERRFQECQRAASRQAGAAASPYRSPARTHRWKRTCEREIGSSGSTWRVRAPEIRPRKMGEEAVNHLRGEAILLKKLARRNLRLAKKIRRLACVYETTQPRDPQFVAHSDDGIHGDAESIAQRATERIRKMVKPAIDPDQSAFGEYAQT